MDVLVVLHGEVRPGEEIRRTAGIITVRRDLTVTPGQGQLLKLGSWLV